MRESPIHHGLERAAQEFAERDAILAGDDRWTFADLDRASSAFARHLVSLGVVSGSRIIVMLSNRPEFVTSVYSIAKLGATAVLVNPAWKALEVDHALAVTGAEWAVADGPAVSLLGEHIDPSHVVDLDDEATVAAVASQSSSRFVGGTVDPGGDVLFVFSSGTTGLPKAVRHTHRSFGAATRHWRDALGLGPDDRFQVATPPSHILGLLNLATAISAGASVRLHRRFDLDELLWRIQSERMTLEMAVAPIALAMANHPDLEKYDLSSLRYIMWGATPVTPSVAETVTRRTGVRWLPAYGASEVPVISANPVGDPDRWRLDSAGLAPAGVELRVADLDTGEILPAGGIGEIQVWSPSAMAGYLPAAADRGAFVDGWYRTGDVGWLEPEGWVHLTDRSKEMIKVNGFQVAPAEIEAVLHGHPSVLDCAVFGVSDERAGEVPYAAVQIDPAHPVAVAELVQLVADSLATYKRLNGIVSVDVIPRLPSGKVLRRTLREEWEPRLAPGRRSD